jgi:heat shock protein 4
MVGEATRIPIVQEVCKEILGLETVNRTLNSLECVARGASLQAAMLSPHFKVSDYEVQEFNTTPVSITYSFPQVGEENPKQIVKELFPIGSSYPSTKTITFDNKTGGMNLMIHYTQGFTLLPGLPTQISQYTIKEGKVKHPEGKHCFILRVSNNIHQIPCLETAELQEDWVEEEKIPIKKDVPAKTSPPATAEGAAKGDKPDESKPDVDMKDEKKNAKADKKKGAEEKKEEPVKQEFEIKKKNKKTTVALNFEASSHALTP